MSEMSVPGVDLPRPLPGETPNAYWDRLVKENQKNLAYEVCSIALARRLQGYARYMPAHLAAHFVEFPRLIEMSVRIEAKSNPPEEFATFTWRVLDCEGSRMINVSAGEWVPDVNDWELLARFFHKKYTEGVQHEIDELFKFVGGDVFNPHVIKKGHLSYLDGKTEHLNFLSLHRRDRVHDLSGK